MGNSDTRGSNSSHGQGGVVQSLGMRGAARPGIVKRNKLKPRDYMQPGVNKKNKKAKTKPSILQGANRTIMQRPQLHYPY
jgi:hypothetical protein